jgi:hypothetical protein
LVFSLSMEFWVVKCSNSVYDINSYMRVSHGEYMPEKVDGRRIGLVLSSQNTIVHLKQLQNIT